MTPTDDRELAIFRNLIHDELHTFEDRLLLRFDERIEVHASHCPVKKVVEERISEIKGGWKAIAAVAALAAAVASAIASHYWK